MPKHPGRCPQANEIDLYTGCSFGCAYCIGRPRHKNPVEPAPGFEAALRGVERQAGRPHPWVLSPWTDAYQPLEAETRLTRRLMEALARRGDPFFVITRSCLVARDLDLLAQRDNAFLALSLGSLEEELTGRLEPGAPGVKERCELLTQVVSGGQVRTVVKIDPLLPGLTDGRALERLVSWLGLLRPHAVTAETLRLTAPLAHHLRDALSRAELRRLLSFYPRLDHTPRHPAPAYRLLLFSALAARLGRRGIRACFCRATLPLEVTPFDCRGGYHP